MIQNSAIKDQDLITILTSVTLANVQTGLSPSEDGHEHKKLIGAMRAPAGETPFTLYGLLLEGNTAYVTLSTTPEMASSMLAESLRAHLESRLSVQNFKLVLSFTKLRRAEANDAVPAAKPASAPPSFAHHGSVKKTPAPKPVVLAGVANVIAVASGKGGVGKSTMAAALAVGLAKLGLKVGLLDADIYGPSLPRIFGLNAEPELDDNKAMIPLEAYGVKLMSIGFMLEDNAATVWRGPMVGSAVKQMLQRVAWGTLDVLLVDMPPGTGDAQLSLVQTVKLRGAVIVSTPQDLALMDALRAIKMFEKVDVPILGLIENMSQFICPHCGGRSDIFSHGGARHEAEQRGLPFLGEAPLAMAIRESMDAGEPLLARALESAEAKMLLGICEKLVSVLGNAKIS